MQSLTPSEKAALYFQIIERVKDWKQVYKIAIGPDRYEKLTTTSQNASASKWKQSDKIQKAYRELTRYLEARQNEIKENAIKKFKAGNTETTTGEDFQPIAENINFLDPEEFLKHANQQANRIKDDKERRSWLEMIAKLMNYKEQGDGETTEIKRFYIMKTCENCEIYQHCRDCEFTKCPKAL